MRTFGRAGSPPGAFQPRDAWWLWHRSESERGEPWPWLWPPGSYAAEGEQGWRARGPLGPGCGNRSRVVSRRRLSVSPPLCTCPFNGVRPPRAEGGCNLRGHSGGRGPAQGGRCHPAPAGSGHLRTLARLSQVQPPASAPAARRTGHLFSPW